MYLDIGGIDLDCLARSVGCREAYFVEEPLHHCLQAAGTNVLDTGIGVGSDPCNCRDAVLAEIEGDALGGQKCTILLDEAGLGFSEDALQVFPVQRLQFDADRQAPLELGQQDITFSSL